MHHTNGGEPLAAPPPADTGLRKAGLNRTWWEIGITFPTPDPKFLRVLVGDLETIP